MMRILGALACAVVLASPAHAGICFDTDSAMKMAQGAGLTVRYTAVIDSGAGKPTSVRFLIGKDGSWAVLVGLSTDERGQPLLLCPLASGSGWTDAGQIPKDAMRPK